MKIKYAWEIIQVDYYSFRIKECSDRLFLKLEDAINFCNEKNFDYECDEIKKSFFEDDYCPNCKKTRPCECKEYHFFEDRVYIEKVLLV